MLLAVDIGNSSTSFGLFVGDRLRKKWRVDSVRLSGHPAIRDIIVCSVVPKVNALVKRAFPGAVFVDYRNAGIKVKIKKPSEVGADRLVDAYAAKELYGCPAIVVDFGTATTFDVVSDKGEYLGGAIAPGIQMAMDALHEKTAKLPRITIKPPRNVIGRSTVEAIRSGILYGYVALVEGMIARFKSEILNPKQIRNTKFKILVVATGGYARLIAKYAKGIDIIDQDLTLKGLNLLWQKN